MRRKTVFRVCVGFITPIVLAGCGQDDGPPGPVPSPGQPEETAVQAPLVPGQPVVSRGRFAPYTPGAVAITYAPAQVPAGATAEVTVDDSGGRTTVTLAVTGLLPDRTYGAHLHVNPCGSTGAAAGPHHQQIPDPAASASPPSVDPRYANPRNEVWLDFTTNAAGAAVRQSAHPWVFPPDRPARSLVLHAERTRTAPGEAGEAGARLACLTLTG